MIRLRVPGVSAASRASEDSGGAADKAHRSLAMSARRDAPRVGPGRPGRQLTLKAGGKGRAAPFVASLAVR